MGKPQGLVPGQAVAQWEIGNLSNFVYLIIDWKTRECAWVDPQRDLQTPLEAMRTHGLKLTRILLTHTHHDHVAGLRELALLFPQAPVTLHEKDHHRIAKWELPKTERLEDGARFRIGGMEVTCLHTPGHSAGAFCYHFTADGSPYLLTGDTVFIRDCGRTDLETGSVTEMYESLQKLKKLAPATIIYPGHHYAPECESTLAAELKTSPPFLCATEADLAALP